MNKLLILVALVTCLFGVACASETGDGLAEICPTCVTSPEGQVADDSKPTGVYKGVIYGGTWSGALKVAVATDQSGGTAELKVGGQTYTSTSFTNNPVLARMSAIIAAGTTSYTFAGNFFTLTLILDDSGNVVDSQVTVSGDVAGASMAKESSTVLVECFEGTWEQTSGGHDTGVWNMVVYGTFMLGGATSPPMVGGWGTVTGTLDGNDILVDNPPDSGRTASGTMSEDHSTVEGVWAWPGAGGIFIGKRTL